MRSIPLDRNKFLLLCGIFVHHAAHGVMHPLMSSISRDYSFTQVQLGLLSTTTAAAAIIGVPAWVKFSRIWGYKGALLVGYFICLVGAVGFALILLMYADVKGDEKFLWLCFLLRGAMFGFGLSAPLTIGQIYVVSVVDSISGRMQIFAMMGMAQSAAVIASSLLVAIIAPRAPVIYFSFTAILMGVNFILNFKFRDEHAFERSFPADSSSGKSMLSIGGSVRYLPAAAVFLILNLLIYSNSFLFEHAVGGSDSRWAASSLAVCAFLSIAAQVYIRSFSSLNAWTVANLGLVTMSVGLILMISALSSALVVVIGCAIVGVGFGLVQPAASALISDHDDVKFKSKTMGNLNAIIGTISCISPIFSLLVIGISPYVVIVVCIGAALVGLASMVKLR